ncbi:MAG: hypothetical protein KGH50_02155, partial [Candidatus Micrarchaeota archaeon]|nr:hypothetical protein [Candidatus Micrarchaeota archaeon]
MAQKMQQKGPRTRSITEIADAAIGYFNVISSNAVGRGRIGYIDSKKWNAIAKDGFSSYYDRNEVAISGGVESVRLDEKDRAYEILRPIVYHYRDRSGMISHAKADNAEAFSKDIANGSASVLCAIVVSLHFMKDDGALKGPMEANIVRELMRNLKGLGPESFNEDSIAENADSGFVRNSF